MKITIPLNKDLDSDRIESSGVDLSVVSSIFNIREEPIGKINSISIEGDSIIAEVDYLSEVEDVLASFDKKGLEVEYSITFAPLEWKDKKEGEGIVRIYQKIQLLSIEVRPTFRKKR